MFLQQAVISHLLHALKMLQPVHGFDRYFLITFQNHHGMATSSGTIELHRRNVDRLMLQYRRQQ